MKRLAIIGCGLRSDCYMHHLRDGLGTEWEVVALADPSPVAIEVYKENWNAESAEVFVNGPKLLAAMKGKIDAAIIGSPNSLHTESIIPALEQDLIIMLEKPVVTTIEDCQKVWQAAQKSKSRIAVGFVLRYTTFYRKVKEIVESGKIGDVLSINATEQLAAPLTSMYTRQWRRFDELAGSFILEKCSHDTDILNMLAGTPEKVSSFASRTHFNPKPEAAMHCKDCKIREDCRYDVARLEPYLMNVDRREEIERLIPSDNDLCVFNAEKDVPDHQNVTIQYENGIQATFSAIMDQPRTTRTISIFGTTGQVIGDIGKDDLKIRYHIPSESGKYKEEQVSIDHDGSGHHGGDSVITEQFIAMLRDQDTPPLAGLKEGLEAGMIAMAAEQSRHNNKIVDMTKLLKSVFTK